MSEHVPQSSGNRRLFHLLAILIILAALAVGAYMIYGAGVPCGCVDEFTPLRSGLRA